MKCHVCNMELGIIRSKVIVEGDNSADEETKIFREHELACRNKNCSEYQKIAATVRNPIEIG